MPFLIKDKYSGTVLKFSCYLNTPRDPFERLISTYPGWTSDLKFQLKSKAVLHSQLCTVSG